jgi:hypothetical protein
VSVQARKLELHVLDQSASRIIFREPLKHLMTVMWWSTVVLKPHLKTGTEAHVFQ